MTVLRPTPAAGLARSSAPGSSPTPTASPIPTAAGPTAGATWRHTAGNARTAKGSPASGETRPQPGAVPVLDRRSCAHRGGELVDGEQASAAESFGVAGWVSLSCQPCPGWAG